MLPLSQRPLSSSDADTELFVDRAEELGILKRSVSLGLSSLVLGDPGSGRTSLLRQLERELDRPTVFVDGRPWASGFDLTLAIVSTLSHVGEGIDRPPPAGGELWADMWRRTASQRANASDRAPALDEASVGIIGAAASSYLEVFAGEVAVVLLDGAGPAAAHDVFGRFRDVVWDFPLRWVLTGDIGRRHQYLAPPADAFFETVIELAELNQYESRQLLLRRLDAAGADPRADALRAQVDTIVHTVVERTPRNLLAAARAAVVSPLSPKDLFSARAAAHQRAGGLGRSQLAMYLELEALGPRHAGDDQLLSRLGYTRERAVQVLKGLEEAGLVIGTREGRRVVYAVAPPEDLA